MKLTDTNVSKLALPPGKTDAFFWDDDVTGLAVRLRSGGAKPTWVFQYRSGYRSRRMTLGAVSAMSASAARARAIQLYAQVKAGGDPASEKAKATAEQGETFLASLNVYLKRQAERLRRRSFLEVRRHLVTHCKPLHKTPLAEIGRTDIARVVSHLADSAGKVTANRIGSSCAAFFGWVIREGLVDNNPAATLNKQVETSRSRTLSDSELRTIWKATGATDQYGSIVRLVLLTGCRREEVGGLVWSEIDFDSATITLPPERTRTKREHIVPLLRWRSRSSKRNRTEVGLMSSAMDLEDTKASAKARPSSTCAPRSSRDGSSTICGEHSARD